TPLIMEGRTSNIPMAISYDKTGTDVNFSALTRKLFENLADKQVELNYEHEVRDIQQREDGVWEVKVKDLQTNDETIVESNFVFIGAGGASLQLLQKTGIKESKHIGGFPVSGLFLVCKDEAIAKKHLAKVYG
ncbi:malate:quinone oxidoreductase, partial [Mammaliicoccus sciuri]